VVPVLGQAATAAERIPHVTDPRDAELARLRRLIEEFVQAWRVYFAATGGKPEELWPTFKALADECDKKKAEQPSVYEALT
jgi:hypothetical protein